MSREPSYIESLLKVMHPIFYKGIPIVTGNNKFFVCGKEFGSLEEAKQWINNGYSKIQESIKSFS